MKIPKVRQSFLKNKNLKSLIVLLILVVSKRLKHFVFNLLGAYMCQGTNIGGTVRDISSLIVQDEPTPSKSVHN